MTPPMQREIPAVLSMAGSDSGGGAGIQADLKAFAASGVHGMTAITALTAQSTRAVLAVEPVSGDMILSQARAVAEDIGVDAVKVGMLGDLTTIATVAAAIDMLRRMAGYEVPVVVDPVMVSDSGARLLADEAVGTLVTEILPRATVVTPNLAEARVLAGAGEEAERRELLPAVHRLGPDCVVLTGGHSEDLVDLAYDGSELLEIAGDRHPGESTHGSGCTHSSALAARLAVGDGPLQAARFARRLAGDAVARGLDGIGGGAGPVDALGILSR